MIFLIQEKLITSSAGGGYLSHYLGRVKLCWNKLTSVPFALFLSRYILQEIIPKINPMTMVTY